MGYASWASGPVRLPGFCIAGDMGSVLRMRNAGPPAQAAVFAGLTSLIAHSAPERRQAVPWSAALRPARPSAATKARQISSSLTKGCPTGVNAPFKPLSGIVPGHRGAVSLRVEGDGKRRLGAPPILLAELGRERRGRLRDERPGRLGLVLGHRRFHRKGHAAAAKADPGKAHGQAAHARRSRRASPNRRKAL